MSTIRDPATITKVGRQMMTAGGDITYTKATLYGQDISHLTKDQLESLTSIGNPLMTVPLGISDKNDNGNGTTVILEATFQNSNLKADLPYTAVGFFAKRGDDAEKLIAVGVATEGAYLAATSPDGVATDALDIKVAIAIGDSANVTAMIDPAGSVTPAALHNAITDVKSEMKTSLDTKADKSTVDSDVKSINDTLATKADKQTVTDDLATKADKTDVDARIGTVNKSVSDLSDTVKANKDDTDKVLATKADKATVESELSTKANQSDLDKTNAEVAKKANTTDVNSQLATKADAKDVTDALALKDDTADVDKKISNVTNSVNSLSSTVTSNKSATDTALGTKANANDVANSFEEVSKSISDVSDTVKANKDATDQALATKADKTTVEQELAVKANSSDVDKKLDKKADKSSVDAKINAIDFSKIKFRKQRVNSDGQAADTTWSATKNSDGSYTIDIYQDDWTAYKVASLLRAITTKADQSSLDATNKVVATKANSSDVYTKKQVDDAFSSRDATIATKADKATVDAEISKIDFTPYAKTADVDSKLQGYTNTADLTKLLDVKANAVDVYSKTELDKKLLDLSTDTDGKVNADQVSSMIANKVDKSDLASDLKSINDSIATKADKTTVESDLATKADQSSLDETNAEVAKKADKADITKQIKTVTDLANSKADATYSYSKAELDKKLLAVTTTADGKVGADQVAQMIAGKADKDTVDKQIKAVTDSVATKANSDDVYSKTEANNLITDAKNTGKQAQATADSALAGYNKRPVISGGASDDLLSFKTTQLRYYPGNGNTCKNLPPATNQQWFTVEYIFENPNGDGIAIYRSPANEIWTIGNNGSCYDQAWVKVANANDIQGLQNQINTKLASGDLPTELQKITFRKQYVDGSNKLQDGRWKLVKQADGSYLVDLYHDDCTAQRVADLLNQIGSKADTATVNSQVADAKNAANKAQTTADNANNNANGRLSLNGGTMGSTAQISFANSGTWGTSNKPAGKRGGLRWDGQSDSAEIYADEDGSDNLDLVFQIGDDGSNHFSFRNQVGAEVAAIQSNGHYTGTIDWASVNGRPDVATHADVNNKVNVQGDLFRLATAGNTWVDILGVANSDTPVLVSIRDQGSGNLLGNYAAAIAFGGEDTKGVLNVAYSDHTARIIGGNGNAPVWHEDIAWKSDINNVNNQINSTNQTVSALQQTIKTLNDTISSANATIKTLQDTITKQATTITGLQTQVSNQAQDIAYIKANYIEGKRFSKANEAAADAWEKENSQRLAFITDN